MLQCSLHCLTQCRLRTSLNGCWNKSAHLRCGRLPSPYRRSSFAVSTLSREAAQHKTLSLWTFIEQVISSTHLADNHSKVLLIQAQSGTKVSIITSQNLTRGNRNESYIITTDDAVFDKFKAEVLDLIKNHSVPLSDILTQKLSQ